VEISPVTYEWEIVNIALCSIVGPDSLQEYCQWKQFWQISISGYRTEAPPIWAAATATSA